MSSLVVLILLVLLDHVGGVDDHVGGGVDHVLHIFHLI